MRLRLFTCLLALAASAFAQDGSRPATPPQLPKGAYAHWHSGKTLQKPGELTLVDLIGNNHIVAPTPSFSLAPGGGIVVDGTQSDGVRLPMKQPIGNRFDLGVDIRFDAEGPEHQTVAYLYRFAELRYRRSKNEIVFNVWQTSVEDPAKELVTSVRMPAPAGKWIRVRGEIDDKVARLHVNEAVAESKLAGSWELLPASTVLLVGKGGADRNFRGQFDHLFLALKP